MSFDPLVVTLLCLGYLLINLGIAYSTERGWIPDHIVRHPATYILSLGIFASAWVFYGVIDLAFQFGYGALTYYLGTGALFLFAPVILTPLVTLARRFQIHSLADLLVFRYHSRPVGAITTGCMLLGSLPLLALQLQAVSDTAHILTQASDSAQAWTGGPLNYHDLIALAYCAMLAAFTILFGSNRSYHRGLVTAMAFESLLKVCALLAIGLIAVFGVFDGLAGLDNWLAEHPQDLALLHTPMRDNSSHTLLLVFIATTVAMPHIFHMSVVENPMRHATYTVTWAFPLFLLLMALPIFPILWAGFELSVPLPVQYFTLGIPMALESPSLTILAFLGGLSAATGALVAITLAIVKMLLNHWLLPTTPFNGNKHDLYNQLLWMRRGLICAIFAAAYLFYSLLNDDYSLTDLALTAFIQTLQLLPGIVAVIYWPRANRNGLMVGLGLGTGIWLLGLLLPALSGWTSLAIGGLELPIGIEHWNEIALLSLLVNCIAFIGISHFTHQSEEEQYSASLCTPDEITQPVRTTLNLHTIEEFKLCLSPRLGLATAGEEVDRALQELGLKHNERRPYALRRLRDQLEGNLSSLLGISIANEILNQYIPHKIPEGYGTADINLMESRLNRHSNELTGLAKKLNHLRLYHRKTLQELPMAVCTLGQDQEILMWNSAMAELTQIQDSKITGSHMDDLPDPWHSLIGNFSRSPQTHLTGQQIEFQGQKRWLSLHKASIEGPVADSSDGQVILVEDVTETQLLEQELMHSERLASVGRLAAGVAHEIGNPITGIDCLAQNLRYETDSPEVLDTAEQILSQTERVSRIVHSLVNFSHSREHSQSQFEPLQPYICAQEAINLLSLQKDKTQVSYHNHIDPELSILGDSQRLIQVFVNLLSNARDASPEQGQIKLRSEVRDNWAIIHVVDQGPGIAAEHMERILEPFFTTKEPGEGTGLGLAMTYSIIEDHRGHIDASNSGDADCGAQFTIRLPINSGTELAETGPEEHTKPASEQ